MKSLRVLLPILLGAWALLFWLNKEKSDRPTSFQSDLELPSQEAEFGDSADVEVPQDSPPRKHANPTHLLRTLHLDGAAAQRTTFFLEEENKAWTETSSDGSLEIPGKGPSIKVAALSGGQWSKVRTLKSLDRSEQDETLLQVETDSAKVHLWIHHPNQTPVQNFRIQARWSGQLPGETRGEALRGPLWTRAHTWEDGSMGTMDFLHLPPGQWTFKAQAEGMAEATASIELLPGESEMLPILLKEGSFVSGQALEAPDTPLAGAKVMLLRKGAGSYLELVPPKERSFLAPTNGKAESDSKGLFQMGPLEAGSYRLQIYSEGFQAWLSDSFDLNQGEGHTFPPIILKRGAGLLIEVVHALDQTPIPHAEVSWLGTNALSKLLDTFVPWEEGGTTNAQGRLQLENLPQNGVQVRAHATGFSSNQIPSNPDSESLRIELQPSIQISGRVFDKQTLEPIPNAEIRAWQNTGDFLVSLMGGSGNSSNFPTTTAGENGGFTLDGLGPGEWQIRADAEDYAPQSAGPIHLRYEDPIQNIDIPLGPGATVLVTVLDNNGLPQVGSILTSHCFEGEASPDGKQTDPNGQATFEHLPLGYYQFQVFKPGFESSALAALQGDMSGLETLSAFLKIEEEKVYELELGGAILLSSLSGHITRSDQPVEGLTIMLNSLSGMKTAKTDDIGYYEIEDVREGDYMMLVGKFGLGNGVGIYDTLRVSPGEAIKRDFDLPASSVRVIAQDAQTGEPLSNIPVMLRPSLGSAGGGYLNTDSDGIAFFDLLIPGSYVLSVGHSAMPLFGGGHSFSTVILEDFLIDENGKREVVVPLQPGAQLKATVLNSFGEPIQGAGVFACSPSGQAIGPFSLKTTDPQGRITLDSLPEGELLFLARHPSHGTVERTVHLLAGQSTSLELVLEAGCMVKVQVVDSNQQPQTGVLAILLNPAGVPVSNMMAGSQAVAYGMNSLSGGEQILGPFLPGEYTLLLAGMGGQNKKQKITIEPGVPEMQVEIEY